VELEGCAAIAGATKGARLVAIAATETEARPLISRLTNSSAHSIQGKAITVGSLPVTIGARGPNSREAIVVGVSGCDKANAAHLVTCLLQAMNPRPRLVVQFGIAGAFVRPGHRGGAQVGDLVIATEEAYGDTGSSSPDGWLSADEIGLQMGSTTAVEGRFRCDAALVRRAHAAIRSIEAGEWSEAEPNLLMGPCVTLSCATGVRDEGVRLSRYWGALVESMEGAAAAHICGMYRIPFLEIRGVSNMVEDRDRSSWQVDRATAVAGRAVLAAIPALLSVGVDDGG